MKKSPLSPYEIKNISQLLLSEIEDSAELGYELIKQNSAHTEDLLHELILLLMLGSTGRLQNKVRGFLSKRYSKDGQYQLWKKQWELFKELDYSYSYSPETKQLLEAHEEIRLSFRPYVIKNRNYARSYYNIGRILQYRYEKEFDLAISYYDTALAGNTEDADAWFNMGYLMQTEFKNGTKALHCYESAIAIDPLKAAAFNNIGALYADDNNNFEKALGYYEKAHQLAPHYEFYTCNVAQTHLKLRNTARFEEMIQMIFKSNRHYQRAMNSWANYLWEYKKDYDAAEKEYKLGLRYYPSDTNLLGNLGEMYAAVFGKYEEAYEWYLKSLAQQRSVYRLTTMFSLLMIHLKRKEEALSYYEELKTQQKGTITKARDLNEEQWAEFQKAEKLLLSPL
jgi:tetratricopeptide (TPR) repeat protein